MKPEKTWNDAMDSLCQIMLNEWSKEEIIEYIRCRDGYTKNDMNSLPIKEFKCKDVYGREYVLSYTDAPMVEYAPVVRCKDCGYWDRDTVRQNSNDFKWWNEAICKQHSLIGCNEPHEMWTDANWFCADGERKEQDDD